MVSSALCLPDLSRVREDPVDRAASSSPQDIQAEELGLVDGHDAPGVQERLEGEGLSRARARAKS